MIIENVLNSNKYMMPIFKNQSRTALIKIKS